MNESAENQGGSLGTDAINQRILNLYPDQPNPLQATAMVKYWLVLLSDNASCFDLSWYFGRGWRCKQ